MKNDTNVDQRGYNSKEKKLYTRRIMYYLLAKDLVHKDLSYKAKTNILNQLEIPWSDSGYGVLSLNNLFTQANSDVDMLHKAWDAAGYGKEAWNGLLHYWKSAGQIVGDILTLAAKTVTLNWDELPGRLKATANAFNDHFHASYEIGTALAEGVKAGNQAHKQAVAEATEEAKQYVQKVEESNKDRSVTDSRTSAPGTFSRYALEAKEAGANMKDKGELIALRKQYASKQRLGNHPEWYGQYPEILPNALNFGVRKEANGFDMAIGARIQTELVIPQKDGKVSQSYKDAIRAIFIKLRGSNNGAFNYDDQDTAAYIEIARGIYATYYGLQRDLKLINNLDPYVAKTPEPILALAGYTGSDYQDLIDNRANHIIRLNQLAHKIEITMPIPPSMTVFERDKYIATSVVEEGKGPKSSLYVYSLSKVLTADSYQDLNEFTINGSMTSRINKLETLINNIYAYENPTYGPQTLVKIAGDMIKAYGDKAFKSLPLNSESDKCTVIRDEYLLNQIQNNNMIQFNGNGFSLPSATPAYSVTYEFEYSVDGSGTAVSISKSDLRGIIGNPDTTFIINRNSGNISNLECISLTRGNFTVDEGTNNITTGTAYTLEVQDCGTDIIDEFRYYYFEEGTNDIKNVVFNSGKEFNPLAATLWGQVDYSPMLTAYPANNKAYIMLDLDTYAYCSLSQFKVMNDAAVLSEYKTVAITSQVNFKTARK